MKNKIGVIGGFIVGIAGFLLMFKLTVLNHTPPEDELAPGIVILAAVLVGIFFALVGRLVEMYFRGERDF